MPDLGSVLIVDDNCELAENLREILEDCGCIVDVAFNGADALRLLELRPYRLVLTDMRMPGMEGHEMMAAMKSRWPGLPVAVMTAFANEANLSEVRRLGALHIFAKPLDLDALFNFIENALASERHVLVVEDDDCLRSNLVEILQQIDGVIPHPATTLHDAQRILEHRPIKCAIVDIGLPDGDGSSLVRDDDGKPNCALVPLIFVSGVQKPAKLLDSLDTSTRAEFLMKPFSVESLLESVRRVI